MVLLIIQIQLTRELQDDSHPYRESIYRQQIGRYQFRKLFGYSINITTQRGESEPMDLPFLLPQSLIFRAYGLTPDLKMR
jgi:hypothetical protein